MQKDSNCQLLNRNQPKFWDRNVHARNLYALQLRLGTMHIAQRIIHNAKFFYVNLVEVHCILYIQGVQPWF